MKLKTLFVAALCGFAGLVILTPDTAEARKRPKTRKEARKRADTLEIYRGEAIPFTEYMPLFRNANVEKYTEWVNSHVSYPRELEPNGPQGVVTATFVVTKEGKLTGIEILKSPHEAMSKETIRIMKLSTSTKWEPGLDSVGNPVDVRMNIPVRFFRR